MSESVLPVCRALVWFEVEEAWRWACVWVEFCGPLMVFEVFGVAAEYAPKLFKLLSDTSVAVDGIDISGVSLYFCQKAQ